MNVFWTPDAKLRLLEIEAYIAKDSSNATHETAIRLIRRSLELQQPPLLGKRLQQYADADIRELL